MEGIKIHFYFKNTFNFWNISFIQNNFTILRQAEPNSNGWEFSSVIF